MGGNPEVFNTSIGHTFKAEGSENPTTGYVWNMIIDNEHKCGPEGSIVLLDKQYHVRPHRRGWTGVGGRHFWEFKITDKAVSGSDCKIKFRNDRPWMLSSSWKNSGSGAQSEINIHIN